MKTQTKPVLRYVTLEGGLGGLSTDSEREIMRSEGTANVQSIRNATQKDVDWVASMGGRVPVGRIVKQKQKSVDPMWVKGKTLTALLRDA